MMKTTTRKKIYLFRHGQTDWNHQGRIQGHLDVPLNELGKQQAARLRDPIRRLGVQALLSSDLSRASETARIAAEGLHLPLHLDSALREIFFGKLQGLSRSEIEEQFGIDFSNRLRHSPLTDEDMAELGCETGSQVALRSVEAIHRFFAMTDYSVIGIVSHGGVIRRIIQHADEAKTFPAPIPNGVLYPLQYEPESKLIRIDPIILLP